MQYDSIDGLDKKISKLIMGNDNQVYFDEAAKLWDHWIEVGGNAFDNAYVYGQGSMEKLFGDWHRKRNNLKELVVGDCLVHESFGVGRYLGVKTLKGDGSEQDLLVYVLPLPLRAADLIWLKKMRINKKL